MSQRRPMEPAKEPSDRFRSPDDAEADDVDAMEMLYSRAADGEISKEEEEILRAWIAADPARLQQLENAVKLSSDLDGLLSDLDVADGLDSDFQLPKLTPLRPVFEGIPFIRWLALGGSLLAWPAIAVYQLIQLRMSGLQMVPPMADRTWILVAAVLWTLIGIAVIWTSGRLSAASRPLSSRKPSESATWLIRKFQLTRRQCIAIQLIGLLLTVLGCVLWFLATQPMLVQFLGGR